MQNLAKTVAASLGLPSFLIQMVLVVVVLILALFLLKGIDRLIDRMSARRPVLGEVQRVRTYHSLLVNVVRVVVWFFALSAILSIFGINTASLLTAAGIGGIAVALGAQRVVSDIISGALLLFDNTINVGDYVTLQNTITGEVKELRLRQVVVRGYTGMLYIIPNAEVKVIANYGHGPLQADISIDIPYGISIEQAKGLVQDMAVRLEAEAGDHFVRLPYWIGVDAMHPFSYTVTIGAQTQMDDFFTAPRRMREIMIEELQAIGAYDAPLVPERPEQPE